MLKFSDFDYTPDPDQIQRIYSSGFRGTTKEDAISLASFRGSAPSFYGAFPQVKGLHTEVSVCLPIRACQVIVGQDFCADRRESQRQGDCVGKMLANQGMVDGCSDAMFGETTWLKDADGKGVHYCCENHYGDRGHSGEGANCWRLWDAAGLEGRQGFLFRKKYQTAQGEFDLSRYRPDLSGPWGRRGTPSALSEIADDNPALNIYKIRSLEEALDAVSFGLGLGRCGNDGYDSNRNSDGLSDVKGTWYHAIAVAGFDRTQRILDKYGKPIWLWYHKWGEWNRGPKMHEQPEGSWWVRSRNLEKDIRNGECCAIGGVVGVDRKLIWESKMDRRSKLKESGLWFPNSTVS